MILDGRRLARDIYVYMRDRSDIISIEWNYACAD